MIHPKDISIIVPAYNEDLAIEDVILDLLKNFPDSEIIIINDGSSDKTQEIINRHNVKVINHKTNKGYGAALKSGIKAAQSNTIITIDADGEHSAESIESLLHNHYDCVMTVAKRTNFKEYSIIRNLGKKFLWFVANLTVGHFIPDINSGLRVFNKNVILNDMDILPNTFSFHTTSTILCLFKKQIIKYVPTETFERKGYSKVDIYSGIVSLLKIIQLTFVFNPFRLLSIFLIPASLITLCVSTIYSTNTAPGLLGFNTLWYLLFCIASLFLGFLTKTDKNLIKLVT